MTIIPQTLPEAEAGWYDSFWQQKYGSVREWLAANRPQELAGFLQSLDVLKTRGSFQTCFYDSVFDDTTLAEIRSQIAGLTPDQLRLHEAKTFRRFVVKDLPFFTRLQNRLLPLVCEATGEELEPSYNFLSLYGERGVCPIHMDSPEAKWTLDVCIDQSAPWPIHFGKVQPWPDPKTAPAFTPEQLAEFDTYHMQTGQAVLFSGSSQWHYRDVMPKTSGKNFCQLIFFHYVPAGTSEVADPRNWQRLFNLDGMDYS